MSIENSQSQLGSTHVQPEHTESEKPPTYNAIVVLLPEAVEKLQQEIEKRKQLREVLSDLQSAVEGSARVLSRAIEDSKSKVTSLVDPRAAKDFAYEIERLDISKHISDQVSAINDYGFFDGEDYFFVNEDLTIPAALQSEEFPRLANITELRIVRYSPTTGEVVLDSALNYDNNPQEDTEYFADIKLKLEPDHKGPQPVVVELVKQ